jgi:hypothetical protein
MSNWLCFEPKSRALPPRKDALQLFIFTYHNFHQDLAFVIILDNMVNLETFLVQITRNNVCWTHEHFHFFFMLHL